MKAVSVFLDVEDPINSLSDDAALDFARLFAEAGVSGSFCMTGEKCRALLSRRRSDVLKALDPHTVGLHTNTHSQHPTTMELLSDLAFEEGCEAAYRAELPGIESFEAAFGRRPSVWGGAGNTWSPEITDALKRLRVPAYTYALTRVPNHAVHRFNGVVGLTQALSIAEIDWMEDGRAASEMERVLRSIGEIDQPWVGVFVGHPSRFRYSHFWDKPYWHGRIPPEPEYADLASDESYERAKANVAIFLNRLKSDFQVVRVDEALSFPWTFRAATPDEIDYFKKHTPEAIRNAARWPVHKPDLDCGLIVHKTLELADSLEIGAIASGSCL